VPRRKLARFLAVVPSCSLLCYLLLGAKLVTLVSGLRASSMELGATLLLFVHKCCVDRYPTRKPDSIDFPLEGIFFGCLVQRNHWWILKKLLSQKASCSVLCSSRKKSGCRNYSCSKTIFIDSQVLGIILATRGID
jgi:hypothetical protein